MLSRTGIAGSIEAAVGNAEKISQDFLDAILAKITSNSGLIGKDNRTEPGLIIDMKVFLDFLDLGCRSTPPTAVAGEGFQFLGRNLDCSEVFDDRWLVDVGSVFF